MRKVDWKRERGNVKWKAKQHPAQNRSRAGQDYSKKLRSYHNLFADSCYRGL